MALAGAESNPFACMTGRWHLQNSARHACYTTILRIGCMRDADVAERTGVLAKLKTLGLRRSSGSREKGLVKPNLEGLVPPLCWFLSVLQVASPQHASDSCSVLLRGPLCSGSKLPPEHRDELASVSPRYGEQPGSSMTLITGDLQREGRNNASPDLTDRPTEKLSRRQSAGRVAADRRHTLPSGRVDESNNQRASSGTGLGDEPLEISTPSHKEIQNLADYYRGRSR